MEDLSINDVKELLTFYRKRSYDLEFEMLNLQLKFNKILNAKASEQINQVEKITSDKKSKKNE